MVKVKTSDQYYGVELKEEATWGTDPGTWGTASFQVPHSAENIKFSDEIFPESAEFGARGAFTGSEKGRRIVSGSLTVEPRYNEKWFWLLFAHCFSSEDVVLDKDMAEAAATGMNTHLFNITGDMGGSAIGGLSMRLFKSGSTDAGSIITVNGLVANRWVWDQPEGDRPKLTIDFIGSAYTPSAASGLSLPALSTTDIKVKAIDLERTGAGPPEASVIKFGNAAMTTLGVSGFTLTCDRGIETTAGYLHQLSTLDKPGAESTRNITLDLTAFLEQDFFATNRPFEEYYNDKTSMVGIQYVSATEATATDHMYSMRFDIPELHWADVDFGASAQGSIPFTASGRSAWGDLTAMDSPFDSYTVATPGPDVPPGGLTDLRMLMQCDAGDDADLAWAAELPVST
jgi:hypothetical protein